MSPWCGSTASARVPFGARRIVVDVTSLLKPGPNEIRIQVANRATNYMADFTNHPLPDYTALNADPRMGGNRFGAQDLNQIQVLPSGLLQTVQLVASP